MNKTSRIKEFYKLSREERLNFLKGFAILSEQDIALLNESNFESKIDFIEQMIENVISVFPMPLGLATNFVINGRDYLIPMVTEEPSVIAGASNAAKMARNSGGFSAQTDKSIMIGQIHILNILDMQVAKKAIELNKSEIIAMANEQDSILVNLGGGAYDLHVRELCTNVFDKTLVIHLLVDVKDAMGANVVNTMCEAIASRLEKLTDGKVLLRILSNLSIYRLANARATWDVKTLGNDLINKIIQANEIAKVDIFRAATHNKGIMNGIDAVCIATGNDFRAVEAGCHAFAAMNGYYEPLTKYFKNEHGNLVGELKIPLATGIVGGAVQKNPMAKLCLKILNVKTASELAQVMVSVGLAQNFAALKALVGEGIQKGHMRLHSRVE